MSKKIIILYTFIALLIPNIALCFTEHLTLAAALCNILLPGALILLVVSATPKVGRNIWFLFPYIFFAAFQIVLLDLYGRSIIAVDMFLNVVTTNVTEATELLGNLLLIIGVIVVLYVPLLVWAGIMWSKKVEIERPLIKRLRLAGIVLLAGGIAELGFAYADKGQDYAVEDDLFPVNVCYNVYLAFQRTVKTAHYHETSADYTFNSKSTHPTDSKEIYIAIIGETSRAENWQLLGYDRPTTPLLSARKDVYAGRNALSESNTTHKSVPMLLSTLSAKNFNDEIYNTKSIIAAFKEAGFKTAFLSNQRYNHSFIDFFGQEADTTIFIKEEGINANLNIPEDLRLLPLLDEIISGGGDKQLIVLHTYGSHFNYIDRYVGEKPFFTPDDYTEAIASNRPKLLNAYDNTIRIADRLVASCIERLDTVPGLLGGVIYASDHGEDIYDDSHERFLHASPLPTIHQVHVPIVMWLSPALKEAEPVKAEILAGNMGNFISTSLTYSPTLADMAGIRSEKIDETHSLFSPQYKPEEPVYLDDHNECVPLKELL